MTLKNDADLLNRPNPNPDTTVTMNYDATKKFAVATKVLPPDSFTNLVNESLNHKALQDRIASTPRRSSSTAIDLYNETRCT